MCSSQMNYCNRGYGVEAVTSGKVGLHNIIDYGVNGELLETMNLAGFASVVEVIFGIYNVVY